MNSLKIHQLFVSYGVRIEPFMKACVHLNSTKWRQPVTQTQLHNAKFAQTRRCNFIQS